MTNKDFIVRNGITLEGYGDIVDSAGVWTGGKPSTPISDTAPANPSVGSLWWNSAEGVLKIYYEDSDGQQWVDASTTLSGDFGTRNVNIINTPTGLYDSDVAVNTTFTLTSSAYSDNLGYTHTSSDWQVSKASDFSTTVVNVTNDTSNLTSYEVTGGLDSADTIYYYRVRYRDNEDNVSNYSANQSFTVTPPPPDTLGQAYGGGYYIGTTTSTDSTCYYLIVAPNATGCAACAWKSALTSSPGSCSLTDGYANTYTGLNNGDHPAGNWTATRTIGGFSDWYMPSRDELNVLYINDGGSTNTNLPAGEGFCCGYYWSSTESSASLACLQCFNSGNITGGAKTVSSFFVRAVRRIPV